MVVVELESFAFSMQLLHPHCLVFCCRWLCRCFAGHMGFGWQLQLLLQSVESMQDVGASLLRCCWLLTAQPYNETDSSHWKAMESTPESVFAECFKDKNVPPVIVLRNWREWMCVRALWWRESEKAKSLHPHAVACFWPQESLWCKAPTIQQRIYPGCWHH